MYDQYIEKIKSLPEETKVGLFIGRDNTEALPQQEGWAWFSLDAHEEEVSDHCHLKVNFNHGYTFFSLKQLFDEVIIDQETWKFFEGNPLPRLASLLKLKKESKLIFEAEPSLFLRPLAKKYFYDHVDIQVPLELEEILAYPKMILTAKRTARHQTKRYLRKLFHQVELIMDEPFPYPTNYRSKADPHFVATHPKPSSFREG